MFDSEFILMLKSTPMGSKFIHKGKIYMVVTENHHFKFLGFAKKYKSHL